MSSDEFYAESEARIQAFVDQHRRHDLGMSIGKPTRFAVWRFGDRDDEFIGFRMAGYRCFRRGVEDGAEHGLAITYVTTMGRYVATMMHLSEHYGIVDYQVEGFREFHFMTTWLQVQLAPFTTVDQVTTSPTDRIAEFLRLAQASAHAA
jgi:hypothetical protein